MKFVNNKSFYKDALRRYGGMIIPANTRTPWGKILGPMKFIGVNLKGYFLFNYRGEKSIMPEGISVYIHNNKPIQDSAGHNIDFLVLTVHQDGLYFLEEIYQSQKINAS
jgi:hypothetical protein